MRLGAQLSQTRGFETVIREAGQAGLQCVQVFSRSPVGGQSRELPRSGSLKPAMNAVGVNLLVVHAPYFVNPATVDPDKLERAHQVLAQEMRRAKRLSAQYVVIHPGHYSQDSKREEAMESLVSTITAMLKAPGRVLIENTAGQGKELGGDFVELGVILQALGQSRRIGLMLDTAHVMASGFPLQKRTDIDALWHVIDKHIGLARLSGIHLNDSLYPVGSHRDRHAHLLEGCLGGSALRQLLHEADTHRWPLILETPGRDVSARLQDLEIIRRVSAAAYI